MVNNKFQDIKDKFYKKILKLKRTVETRWSYLKDAIDRTVILKESIYEFVVRSVISSHINTWNGEVRRIKKELGNDVP